MSSRPAAAAVFAASLARPPADWPDTPQARRLVRAQLERLNADLLSHASATATLQHWCEAHGSPAALRIRAEPVAGPPRPADPATRALLGDAPLAYRRVRLTCGERVLSEAENWYRPDRLTPEMNHLLETSRTPFGVVARALDYRRRTLSAEILFQPDPEGPASGDGVLAIPAELMRHRAVLATPDGAPFALVVETYAAAALYRPPEI